MHCKRVFLKVGRLCEYVHKTTDQSSSKDNFDDFFKTMTLDCHPGDKGSFTWTPTKTGTYYYQVIIFTLVCIPTTDFIDLKMLQNIINQN